MKIGMLIWTFSPEPEGGAERQCRLLTRELTRQGHSCGILASHTLQKGSATDPRGDTMGVERFGLLCPCEKAFRRAVLRLTGWLGGVRDGWGQALGFWVLLPVVWLSRASFICGIFWYALWRKTPPFDILHVHESGWLAGVGVVLARRWRIPVLCKEATSPPLARISYGTPLRRWLDRKRYAADGWLAQTVVVQAQMGRQGVTPDRIHLLPNGVVMPQGAADPLRANTVLYVGNLTQGAAWKAFDILFDAWVRVVAKRPSARMHVAGDGDPTRWHRLLRREGVADTVNFAGRVDDAAVLYRAAGIFVLPSRIEGMSNALLEAQSWGLACAVSDIPGNRAVVEDGVNGLVVPVGDAGALSVAILTLMEKADLRSRLGHEARQGVRDAYDIVKVTHRLVSVYRLLLGERQG